jgi:manganese oxidase
MGLLLSSLVLAGCMQEKPYDPLAYKETGRKVELNISVQDLYETPLYPGLLANLWAFCVSPVDPNDAYSRNAIRYFDTIPGEEVGGKTTWGQDKTTPRPECSVPGPTIVVNQGDRVVVHFSHSHPHPHTIHWHGQFVDPLHDGAPGMSQTAVGPGGGLQSFTYDFIAKRAGTLWYHCHVDTQVHVMQGLFGMFIVKPQDTRFEPEVDHDEVLIMSTATRSLVESIPGSNPHTHAVGSLSGNIGFQNPPQFLEPDVFLINGHSYPLTVKQNQSMYHVREGERLRLRILNAGNTFETLHLHGHDMLVTHRDGVPLLAPFWVDTLTVGPAERYDVVVDAHNPGMWMMHTHVNHHETNDRQSPGGMHTMLVYHGYEDQDATFKAELPGGFGYEKPVFMPQDFQNSTVTPLNPSASQVPSGNINARAEWHFPVELPCAVQHVTLHAFMDGPALATAISSVEVGVYDPGGNKTGSFVLGRGGQPAGSLRINGSSPGSPFPQLKAGTYQVLLEGQAAQVTIHQQVTVDYHSSFEEMKRLHQLDKAKYPLLCGKYGNGTDGIPAGPAPA